ncbi:hypothetical protein [Cohnella silvisoli]|uniref:Type I restriction enzyme R protein N-terminal domain-containing protein n=1 Tax=Cohnella silvisoli TaxID=2873699 RepID=A0ABV1KZD5_9BACL|nr:hypothetical protein [Cohnella silvisoli]MCD9024709.1 hypothetical protein [Cohnella silvisoli]
MAVYNSFIKKAVNNALSQFILRDTYLLREDVSERAITHKFAEYLQYEFGSFYSVDCEYNRNFLHQGRSKIIHVLDNEIRELVKNKSTLEIINDLAYRELSVYPDIIVHKRGKSKNLLVVEVKKSSNQVGNKLDFLKLAAYTDPTEANNLQYQFGLFINFDMISYKNHELCWVKDSRRVQDL